MSSLKIERICNGCGKKIWYPMSGHNAIQGSVYCRTCKTEKQITICSKCGVLIKQFAFVKHSFCHACFLEEAKKEGITV